MLGRYSDAFWYEIPFLMLPTSVGEMYLVGAFISGWMNRRRGRIVTVGIRNAIVLLSGGGEE